VLRQIVLPGLSGISSAIFVAEPHASPWTHHLATVDCGEAHLHCRRLFLIQQKAQEWTDRSSSHPNRHRQSLPSMTASVIDESCGIMWLSTGSPCFVLSLWALDSRASLVLLPTVTWTTRGFNSRRWSFLETQSL